MTDLANAFKDKSLLFHDVMFAPEFSFNEKLFPGANNPGLDGKPVLVLVIELNNTIYYSFEDLSELLKDDEAEEEANEGDSRV